jgi:hypothetical protein
MTPYLSSTFILFVSFAICFIFGSVVLRRILLFVDPGIETDLGIKQYVDFRHFGTWIGFCETFLIFIFILAKQYTAIALLFTAKVLVRADKIRDRPSYYLLGTLLNFSFAVFFAVLVRLTLILLHLPTGIK